MLVRSDQEPAILALIRQAGTAARLESGVEAVPEPARLGDKDANGLAEGAGDGGDLSITSGEAQSGTGGDVTRDAGGGGVAGFELEGHARGGSHPVDPSARPACEGSVANAARELRVVEGEQRMRAERHGNRTLLFSGCRALACWRNRASTSSKQVNC